MEVSERVPALPPGHTRIPGWGSMLQCSSSSPGLSRGAGRGDACLHPSFITTPSLAAPNLAAGPVSRMSHREERQLAPLLCGDGTCGPGHPGEQRAVGWVCTHSPASVHPWLGGCKGWGEDAMPAPSWGGIGASLGEVPSGEPRGVTTPPPHHHPASSLLPSLPPSPPLLGEGHPAPRQMT